MALLTDYSLEVNFFLLEDKCFTIKAKKTFNLGQELKDIHVDRLHILNKGDSLSFAIINRNYHHLVLKISFLEIHKILFEMNNANPNYKMGLVNELHKLRIDFERLIDFERMNHSYQSQKLSKALRAQKRKNRLQEGDHVEETRSQGATLDSDEGTRDDGRPHEEEVLSEDVSELANMKSRLERQILEMMVEGEKRAIFGKGSLTGDLPDILKGRALKSGNKNTLEIGPQGISSLDFSIKQTSSKPPWHVQSRSSNPRVRTKKTSNGNFRINSFKGVPEREKEQAPALIRKQREGMMLRMEQLENELRRPSWELQNDVTVAVSHYYLNNPFQIHQNSDKVKISSMNNVLVLIENVDAVRKLLVYDLSRKAETFGSQNMRKFSLENSIGTSYVHTIRHSMCQHDAEKVVILNFFQTQSHFSFLLLCRKKVYLFEGESKYSSQIVVVRIPKRVSLKINSSTLNSKFFKIIYRNPHHQIERRINLSGDLRGGHKTKSIYLRIVGLILFCVCYLVLLYLLFGVDWKKKVRRTKKKTRGEALL